MAALVDSVVKQYKEALVKKDGERKIPRYYKGYFQAVRMAEDTGVHSFGHFPDRIFDRKVPNETDVQRDYRKSAMEAYTMPVWSRAVGAVQGRIWNEANYDITYNDEEHKAYFTQDYPKWSSLTQWFKQVRLPYKLQDANAVMVVHPGKLPTRLNGEDELVVDDTQMLSPVAKIYAAWQVVSMSDTHALIFTEENSTVTSGTRQVQEGIVFELYTETELWRIVQVGRKVDYTFDYELYYTHDLGVLPVWRLGGTPMQQYEGIFQSYFFPAVADLNTALFDETTLNIAKLANIYPERWEVRSKCKNQLCNGSGKIPDMSQAVEPGHERPRISCPDCGGSGYRPHPLNIITVNLPDRLDIEGGAQQPPTPPVGYLTKDTETVAFLRDEIKRKKEDSFLNLNLDVSNKPNGQTATESKIDREELFSMLLQITSEEFEALGWAVWAIGTLRWGEAFDEVKPSIDAPTNFTIRSYAELTQEMADARENKLPAVAFRRLLEEYMATRFSQDYRMSRLTDLVFYADRLVMASDAEVVMMVAQRLATPTEAVLHYSIYTLIERAIQEKPDFIIDDVEAQAAKITEMAAMIAGGLQPDTADDLLRELAINE